MNVWRQFQAWRHDRLLARLVCRSADAMLNITAQRLGRELTARERADMPALWGSWLCADDAWLFELIDRPTRAIHLFLSELLP